MSSDASADRKLVELFTEGFRIVDEFECRQDATNSDTYQADVKKCINLFEEATKLVSLTGVFSTNEGFEEIATEDLRYLLLPFFLANLELKICIDDRKHNVEIAEIYYKDFLKRCNEYGLCDDGKQDNGQLVPVSREPRNEMERLQSMAMSREAKLKSYREKKELQDQIKQLKVAMSAEHIDDDVKRDFYLKLLKSCIIDARDELITCDQEKQILDHLARRSEQEGARPKLQPPRRPLKPIIITKDAVQKAVYGLGYPSLPTMTVDEFYEDRVREGIFPDAEKSKEMAKHALQNMTEEEQNALEEQDDIEKEAKMEMDDQETVDRARAMDDWKDTHRRGFGNRHNRS